MAELVLTPKDLVVKSVTLPNKVWTRLLAYFQNRMCLHILNNESGVDVWVIYNESDPTDTISIREAAYTWTLSASGTAEYYCRLAAADPVIGNALTGLTNPVPDGVLLNSVHAAKGTLGALTAGTWGFGDNDTLGYNTVYVRLTDGADPDGKAAGWVTAQFGKYKAELIEQPGKFLWDVGGMPVFGVWAYQDSGAAAILKIRGRG